MTKTQVHIVFRNTSEWSDESFNEFIGVFFDIPSAEKWIAECKRPKQYYIETYEQPEEGMAHEVFG